MTPTNRAIWSDAYRLMEAYETPPAGDYDTNKAFWDGLNQGIADFCSKYRNDGMAWKLSVAIFEAISDKHALMQKIPDKVIQEILEDSKRMLFSQQGPEQTRMEV